MRGLASYKWQSVLGLAIVLMVASAAAAQSSLPIEDVEGQPLGANAKRVVEALEFVGAPWPEKTSRAILDAAKVRDAKGLQELLDPHVLFAVSLNPEVRVKVQRGPAKAVLQQGGYTPVLVKVHNDSTVTRELKITSPQSGAVYAGASLNSLTRQAQTELKDNENTRGETDRFLDVEMFRSPPMTRNLSGLEVEYAIALIYSSEAGKREATIGFDVGAGTQDLGFRGEVPVLFEVRPAIPVRLNIRDSNGSPTAARLIFRDASGRVYPPQAKRLAPDFFFQPQIYRHDGQTVLLPPGKFTLESCRGPEYKIKTQKAEVPAKGPVAIKVQLERWIDPEAFGFYCGDHHIHGAGCAITKARRKA